MVDDLPSQTRQGLQATLDGAVQQTADQSERADVAAGSTPLGPVATEFTAVFAERAPVDNRVPRRGVRVPRHATHCNRRARRPTVPTRSPSRGPRRRCRRPRPRTAWRPQGRSSQHSDTLYRSVRRSLAAAPGHGPASGLGVGDRPAGVAARQRGSPGRSRGHLAHAGGDALRRPAHRAPEPARPADAAGRAGERLGHQPDRPRSASTVVLANQGSSDEPHVSVRFSLADQTVGRDDDPGPDHVTRPGRLRDAARR